MSMSTGLPARYAIAESIGRLLERDLGEGVDARRMLNDPLYARDVLLVCEAERGSELHALARQFRKAPAFRMRDPTPTAPGAGAGASRARVPSDLASLAAGEARRRPWYSPARWLGR